MIRHLLVHGGRSKHGEGRRLRTYSKNCSQVLHSVAQNPNLGKARANQILQIRILLSERREKAPSASQTISSDEDAEGER
jgi:hypothetical protein